MNIAISIAVFIASLFAGTQLTTPFFGGGTGTLNQLDQWKSDGTNITQAVASKPIKLTGLESLNCLGTNGSGVVGLGSCGGGASSFPFTAVSYGNATSTTIGLLAGFLSTASSTIVGNATTTGSQSVGSLISNGDRIIDFTGTGLTLSGTSLTVSGLTTTQFSSANVSQWTNDANYLTSVDISANTNLAVTYPIALTGDTLGFNGLSTSSPWTSSNLAYVVNGNTLTSVATGTVSAGSSAITVTANRYVVGGALAMDCAGASGSQNGCLSSTDWTTFNNKISWGAATSTSANQIVYTNNLGKLVSVASSSLSLPNTALQNSTISGVALGSNLNSLSASGSITGTSYNGSAAVSDWALNMANTNSWTVRQNFAQASSTLFSSLDGVYVGRSSTSTIRGDGIASILPYASSTALTVSGTGYFSTASTSNLTVSLIPSALLVTNSTGVAAAYAGTSCTNQFVRSLSALGAATCATVGANDVSLANLTATDSTLSFSGTYNGSTARTIGLNLANANTWTALQIFGQASSTMFAALDRISVGRTATTTIRADGVASSLPYASSTAITATTLYSTTASTTNLTVQIPSCSGSSALTTNSAGAVACGAITASGGTFPFTPTTYSGTLVNSTSTPIWFKATNPYSLMASSTVINFASTSVLSVTGTAYSGTASTSNLTVSSIISALLLTNSTGVTSAYAGSSCTNQFVRSLSALGAATCATVAPTDVNLTTTWDFGGATAFEIPNAASPTVDAIGEIALDTTQNELLVATSTNGLDPIVIKPFYWTGFTFGSSTQGMGSTTKTFFIAPPSSAGYIDGIVCHASSTLPTNSFMRVVLRDESNNRTDDLIASTTENYIKFTTNNAFTALEVLKAEIGTTTNIAANMEGSCRVKIIYTRN